MKIRRIMMLSVSSIILLFRPQALAEPMREFVMSCTYGVLAGTLVGAATLAFTENPGDNLNKIARGASIGLYLGISLGLYVVYAVPEGPEGFQGPALDGEPKTDALRKFSADGLKTATAESHYFKTQHDQRFLIYPTLRWAQDFTDPEVGLGIHLRF